MALYVITTGLPGNHPAQCCFVELEDERGASHGEDVGVRWETDDPFSGPSRARLGPFVSVQQHEAALGERFTLAQVKQIVGLAGLEGAPGVEVIVSELRERGALTGEDQADA